MRHVETITSITLSDRKNSTQFQVGLNVLKPFKIDYICFREKTWIDKNVEDFKLCCKNILLGFA